MSRILKILEKWKHGKQPVPKEQVFAILDRFFPGNWEYKKGSHIVVKDPMFEYIDTFQKTSELIIPILSGQKVKRIYVKELVSIIEYLEEIKATSKEEREK